MIEINLLPWREYTREYQNNMIKKLLLMSLFVILLIWAVLHIILSIRENHLKLSIDTLQNKIRQLDAAVSRTKTKKFKQSTQHFFSFAALLSELGKKEINNVCFTDIVYTNTLITFIGKTRSTADLTDYLRNWSATPFFSQININDIEQKNLGLTQFQFQAVAGSY